MAVQKIDVALLGATGTVGQMVLALLENHPHFKVSEFVGSTRSQGNRYQDMAHWKNFCPMRKEWAESIIQDYKNLRSDYVISALPSSEAKIIEPYLAEQGKIVFSNASSFRMDQRVPLVIPEINGDHLQLLNDQSTEGKIITNPNCAVVFISLALAPIQNLFGGIEQAHLTTLQATSGAGYPGVSSFDILGDIIPNILEEEDKLVTEPLKILGTAHKPCHFSITANVNRVPVLHGHTIIMHLVFKQDISVEQVESVFRELGQGRPELYVYHEDSLSPRPGRDLDQFDQRAHIGRVKAGGNSRTLSIVAMGHNLVRGAAGAALRNMEFYRDHHAN